MNQNIYCKPRIYIGDYSVEDFVSFSLREPGSNQINSLDVVLNNVPFSKSRLFNQEVRVYLNNGTEDSTPIFRGFIKQVTPSDTTLKIRAVDPRGLISGKEGITFNSTDKNNYDGYTVTQFLQAFIKDKVNINKTYIGLDALTEVEPALTMKGVRGLGLSPYQMVRMKIEEAIDDSTLESIKSYAIGVLDDGTTSSITIYKKQPITNPPSLYLNYFDGIEKLTYKERAPHTQVTARGAGSDGKSITNYVGSFTRGNFSTGPINKLITGEYKSNAHAQRMAFLESEKDFEDKYELSVEATKGYYLGIDSIVNIDADKDTNISGNYRLVGKSIKYKNQGKMSLSFQFNKEPVRVIDYLG